MIVGLFRDGDVVRVRYGGQATFGMTRWRYERHDYHPPYRRLPTRQEYEVSVAEREPPTDEKPLAPDLSAGEYMIQFYLDSIHSRSG
jgi:hypothetical protein